MPQVIKKRVVLASVLKPVTDTRMYEKLALSLARHLASEVHVIGFPATIPADELIHFHPVYNKTFHRLSIRRLVAPLKVLTMLIRIKPDVIIVTTHELLVAGVLYKLTTGARLYYDVQENYYYNICYTSAFPLLLRFPIGLYVRIKERLLAPFINYFILAEKGYSEELIFARPYVVLENKLIKSLITRVPSTNRLHLLFSGTLAPTTGVLQAIELAAALYRLNDQIRLTIIGHATTHRFLEILQQQTKTYSFIQLRAEIFPVPHSEILQAIAQAGTGIILYPPNPSTQSSIPTKLYEYLGMQLPVLIRHNTASHELVERCKGGIILTEKPDYQKLIESLPGLQPPLPDALLFWDTEEAKLTEIFRS